MLDKESLRILRAALDQLEAGFADLPPLTPSAPGAPAMEEILHEVAERLQDNYPYFHPLYAGQMLKPPHPVARLAYALAMWINPNNHALDGGRASSRMEKEAVAEIARMFGWDTHLGHLCGGGTMANLEALWVAGQVRPGAAVVASQQAHYTHQRISGVLGLDFEPIPCDRSGRMDVTALERRLRRGGIGTVVATIGTTATGSVDPLPELLDLRDRYGFRLHADAAYGGYFSLAGQPGGPRRAARTIGWARWTPSSSIRTSTACSRTGAAACCSAIRRWAGSTSTIRPTPTSAPTSCTWARSASSARGPARPRSGCGRRRSSCRLWQAASSPRGSASCRAAALALYEKLRADGRFVTAFAPELDIVVWAARAGRVSEASGIARQIFAEAARQNLHLALAELPADFFDLAGRRHGARPRPGHLPAVGPDEAGAPGLDRPHLGYPGSGCRCGDAEAAGEIALKHREVEVAFETLFVDDRGEIVARRSCTAAQFTERLAEGISLDMIAIPGGEFAMGSPPGQGYPDEGPQHPVTVASFGMGKYPVTQAQWQAVMGWLPPCRCLGASRPVDRVSWNAAFEFCERLSEQTGCAYRLPSEAEWEYACRAGTTTPFHFGETITTDLANYVGEHLYRLEPKGIYRHETTEAGSFPPNAFGLYDMHGNVWEWCGDAWYDDYAGAPADGRAWVE